MLTETKPRQSRAAVAIDLNAIRPVYDTMKPVELEAASAETTSPIDHDVQALHRMVVARRVRAFAFAVGAAAFLAVAGVGGANMIAKHETDRALDRVQAHVAAANAALPAAAMEFPPRIVDEASTPTNESIPRVAPLPANGGTPASVLVPPGAKKRARK